MVVVEGIFKFSIQILFEIVLIKNFCFIPYGGGQLGGGGGHGGGQLGGGHLKNFKMGLRSIQLRSLMSSIEEPSIFNLRWWTTWWWTWRRAAGRWWWWASGKKK